MDNNNSNGINQVTLILRICIGGYLAYLAYDLFMALPGKTGGEFWFLLIPAIVFVLVGIALIITSLKKMKDNFSK